MSSARMEATLCFFFQALGGFALRLLGGLFCLGSGFGGERDEIG